MPTVFRKGPYRFFFYSNEGNEPVHIHVESGDGLAKFWVNPVILENSVGFSAHDLAEIRTVIGENVQSIERKWNEFFHGV